MICLLFLFEESTFGSILIYFCILMFAHLNSTELKNLESSLVPICAKFYTQTGVIMFCTIIMFTVRGSCKFSVVDLNKNTDVTHGDVAVVLSGWNFFSVIRQLITVQWCVICYLKFKKLQALQQHRVKSWFGGFLGQLLRFLLGEKTVGARLSLTGWVFIYRETGPELSFAIGVRRPRWFKKKQWKIIVSSC